MVGSRLVVGVCGLYASGKTLVCHHLQALGFTALSLSDAIRDELRRRGIPESRDALIHMGNSLRKDHGPGVLAERMVAHMEHESQFPYVVDSIRHPAEVMTLMQNSSFVLIAITAAREIRYRRIMERQRRGDVCSFEEFVRSEDQEISSSNPYGQQLSQILALASVTLSNEGTREEFENKITAFVQQQCTSDRLKE